MPPAHLKRDFSIEQILRVTAALGAEDYKQASGASGTCYLFQTICHNPPGHGSHKLYYYPVSGLFHCFTQCSDTFDVYTLIQRARHCSFSEAVAFLQATLGINAEKEPGFADAPAPARTDDWELLEKYRPQTGQPREEGKEIILPASLLEYWSAAPPVEWLRERISPQALQAFHIRFNVADNEVIIPHYNAQGQLIGIRSRSFDPDRLAVGGKYMPALLQDKDFRHPLGRYLYGLHQAKPAIARTGKIFLVEGEKSVLQSYSYYGADSFTVALCGSHITGTQRDLVLSLGVREVFLGLDKEFERPYTDQYRKYETKLERLASIFSPYVTTWIVSDTRQRLGYQDSPTDRGKEVLEQLMHDKFEIGTRGDGHAARK